MKSKRWTDSSSRRSGYAVRLPDLFALATLLVACTLAGLASPDTFKWTGGAYNSNSNTANDNWSDEHNWEKTEGETERLWPHHENDVAVIDDDNPEDEVEQDHDGLNVRSLFLGDGHTLNLTKGMFVKGVLECEGVVKLKGNGTLEVGSNDNPIVFRVYSDQDTIITFESGTGSLVAASGG